jgi:DNA-binding transcriptional ArsR family regulator
MSQPDLFRVFADPTRRAVFERLAREGEQTVSALTKASGVSQSAVSQHLTVLRIAGLVIDRREGRHVLYRVQPAALMPLIDWMALYAAQWPQTFDRLEKLLKEMDQ